MSKPQTAADPSSPVLAGTARQTAAYPVDWAGRVMATPQQVVTAERLIRDGKAAPFGIRDYPRARVYLQLKRLVDGQNRGRFYIGPDGRIVGHGYTLAEARSNGRNIEAKRG